jgi:hypothetical protein
MRWSHYSRREEAEFEVVSGCAEGFVSKTMTVSCE